MIPTAEEYLKFVKKCKAEGLKDLDLVEAVEKFVGLKIKTTIKANPKFMPRGETK